MNRPGGGFPAQAARTVDLRIFWGEGKMMEYHNRKAQTEGGEAHGNMLRL